LEYPNGEDQPNTLDRMIETGKIEPSLLSLVAGANAAIAVLDARQRPEEAASA
jgi:hypothetical protein